MQVSAYHRCPLPLTLGNPGRGPAAGQTTEGHIYGGFSQNPYERRPGFP